MNTAVQHYHADQSVDHSKQRSASDEHKFPAGWWILPAAVGGLAMWVKLFMVVLG